MRMLPALLACLLCGCATTRITSDDPNAEIYLDNSLIGVGETEVDRVGPYHRARLEARKGGKVIGTETLVRSFTFKTFLWGCFSYYTGFYWGWYYPESVRIATMPSAAGTADAGGQQSESLWSNPRQSIWMQPLK